MKFFEMLFETAIRGRSRRATSGACPVSAAWSAACVLIGSAFMALSVSAQPSAFGRDASVGRAVREPLNFAQGQWTWVDGSRYLAEQASYGIYGRKGIPDPDNVPGTREGSVSWTDGSGNFWLFGGNDYNDLWKWNVERGQWTWVSGSSSSGQPGIYGTRGVAAPENVPGARYGSVSWTDSRGNLWLFGGSGHAATGAGLLNDLWKWDISSGQWTWVSGSNRVDQAGTYGTKGVAGPGNVPGGRSNFVAWIDTGGNLWLFGGWGHAASGTNLLNDLWKWDVSSGQWTWVSGSASPDSFGTYGAKGVAGAGNFPGAREGSVSWTDASGNFWLFGGMGYSESDSGWLNDLWKWNVSSGRWTWVSGASVSSQNGVYGTKEVSAPENVPGTRYGAVPWTDAKGNLWLFGGYAYPYPGADSRWLNDLWKWDPSSGLWTWVGGSKENNQPGNYGTKGVAAPDNVPGARAISAGWTDTSGNFWLFGGAAWNGSGSRYNLNDLWKWDSSSGEWTWMSGSRVPYQGGSYGTRGVAAPGNVPGPRDGSVSWTDANGDLWLFGGYDYAWGVSASLNDLWKWNPSSGLWTWVSGSNSAGQHGIYGTKGRAAPENVPGARAYSVSWTDAGGDLWLFGGWGYGAGGNVGLLDDLWKRDLSSGLWTWVSGSDGIDKTSTYGAKGIAAPENGPGGRAHSVGWADADGSLWLFGGGGIAGSGGGGELNDLWKWNVSSGEWTWVSGSNDGYQAGTYGSKGVAAPGNVPGGREGSVGWADRSGNLWLFGGAGLAWRYVSAGYMWVSVELNDLWKWDTSSGQWTWVGGSDDANAGGTFGTQGVAAGGNAPGARDGAVSWTDASGNFWLFGGYGFAAGSSSGYLNDLWKWSPSAGEWTWVSGSNEVGQAGTYGTHGVAAPENVPGARRYSISWADTSGNLWLFGGGGHASTSLLGKLNDLWAFSYCSIPGAPTIVPGSRYGPGTVALAASGAVAGQDYKWYAVSKGGSPLQTGGASFTTPPIPATTTYYVSIYDTAAGCEGPRTAVTATVVNRSIVHPGDPLFAPVLRPRG